VLTSTLPRFVGDPEPRFVLDLAREQQKTFDVTLLAPAAPEAALEEHLEGVRVVRYRYAPSRSLETLAYPGAILPRLRKSPAHWLLVPLLLWGQYRAAARLLRRERYDCIHAHWLLPQGIVASRLSRRFAVPYVVTSHGGDIFGLDKPLAVGLKRAVLQGAQRITVVSRAIRDHIASDRRLGTGGEQLTVIPMGVDLTAFQPAKADPDWTRLLGLTRPVILFVGRLAEKKGVTFLLRALAQEPLRSTAACVAIIGDGPLKKELERESAELGIAPRVHFLGALNHGQLAVAYASADIFCLPSVIAGGGDREGLPVVLCEAAASALPAVSTRVSGIGEIVQEGSTGLLVPERDAASLSHALARLVQDAGERRRFAAASRERAEFFGWERIGERFRDVLDSAIESHLRAARHAPL
jgi:glycosyltransferase involved in cell wall biosynthesis